MNFQPGFYRIGVLTEVEQLLNADIDPDFFTGLPSQGIHYRLTELDAPANPEGVAACSPLGNEQMPFPNNKTTDDNVNALIFLQNHALASNLAQGITMLDHMNLLV
jgi:hypothetical protein